MVVCSGVGGPPQGCTKELYIMHVGRARTTGVHNTPLPQAAQVALHEDRAVVMLHKELEVHQLTC